MLHRRSHSVHNSSCACHYLHRRRVSSGSSPSSQLSSHQAPCRCLPEPRSWRLQLVDDGKCASPSFHRFFVSVHQRDYPEADIASNSNLSPHIAPLLVTAISQTCGQHAGSGFACCGGHFLNAECCLALWPVKWLPHLSLFSCVLSNHFNRVLVSLPKPTQSHERSAVSFQLCVLPVSYLSRLFLGIHQHAGLGQNWARREKSSDQHFLTKNTKNSNNSTRWSPRKTSLWWPWKQCRIIISGSLSLSLSIYLSWF